MKLGRSIFMPQKLQRKHEGSFLGVLVHLCVIYDGRQRVTYNVITCWTIHKRSKSSLAGHGERHLSCVVIPFSRDRSTPRRHGCSHPGPHSGRSTLEFLVSLHILNSLLACCTCLRLRLKKGFSIPRPSSTVKSNLVYTLIFDIYCETGTLLPAAGVELLSSPLNGFVGTN